MISNDLWTFIDSRFEGILRIIPEKTFGDLLLMTIADFLQLPPVSGKFILSRFSYKDSMKHLLRLQLWHLLKYAELIGDVRQNDKKNFIDLFKNVLVGKFDDDVEKLIKAKFIHESDKN